MILVADVSVVYGWLPADVAITPPEPAEAGPTPVTLDGGAAVVFPTAPTPTDQTLIVAGSEVLLRLFTAQGADGATYNIGSIDYPEQVNLSDPAVNLIASVSGAAGNIGGRVVGEPRITVFSGSPTVDFTVVADDVRLRARHVLVGRRLYAQNVAYRGAVEPAEADAFFDSFELPASDGTTAVPLPTQTP